MASGWIFPDAVYLNDSQGRLFETWEQIWGGATSDKWYGIGVKASLDVDVFAVLRFTAPNPIPPGVCTLHARVYANAQAGFAKITPSWAPYAMEETIPGTGALEGTKTITWGTDDHKQIKTWSEALDGLTISPDDFIQVVVGFEGGVDWTLAVISAWQFMLRWQ